MRYVLGMAKSHLDTKPGKARNLELDFLRLVLAVTRLQGEGHEAQGYLQVLDPAPAKLIEKWKSKYAARHEVEVLLKKLSLQQADRLRAEKTACARGIRSGRATGDKNTDSVADYGKRLGEESLEARIRELEPGVRPSSGPSPLGVRWDYFGERDDTKGKR